MHDAPVDIELTLARLGGDRTLLANLFRLYLEDTPKKAQALAQAWTCGDVHQVERLAHSLKGSSATVGAEALRQAAYSLELAAKAGDRPAMEAAYTQVERLVAATLATMEAFCSASA